MTTPEKKAKPGELEFTFNSAAIFAGANPRIEFPALCFEPENAPKEPYEGPRLEVRAASVEEMREGLIGLATPQYVVLTLAPADFDGLRKRVRSVRRRALKFVLSANRDNRLERASYDGKELAPGESGVVGPLDFEIEATSG
jgi:hypothetical protein